jgi:adenosine deaminase/aminodeoxyfutalosine deaminase
MIASISCGVSTDAMGIVVIMASMQPLAELHVHLEGTLTPETICEIDPAVTLEEARARFRFTDFRGFIDSYIWANGFLDTPERYAHAARRCFDAFERDGIVYAEVNLSVGMMLWKRQDVAPVLDALETVRPRGVRWIFDAIRQFGPEHGRAVAEYAVAHRNRGVVGFGIGGDEARGAARDFADIFEYVRSNGLAVLPHAGETVGPDSIWQALECGAYRIGHGIRAIDDPVLLRHLGDRDIPLEISITSNVCTGSVASLEEHPVRRLFDAGVPLTLNTDDPGFFGTSLPREYAIARERFGFSDDELERIRQNGFRYSVGDGSAHSGLR